MEFTDFTAGSNDQDRRLDKVIRKMAKDSNISSLYSAIRKGLIKVNDRKTDINYKIQEGDKISIAAFLFEKQNIQTASDSKKTEQSVKIPEINFDTVFVNDFIRIINKPYNINAHGEAGLSSVIESIYRSETHDTSLSFVPGPVHRLDKKTTGLLAFSNNLQGAEWFTKAIAEKTIQKYYIGVCDGILEESVTWNDYIVPAVNNSKDNTGFFTMQVDNLNTDEKNLATTVCTPLATGRIFKKPVTLCQFQILTGKKHQIRCQSAFHNIPLLGDTAYGEPKLKSYRDFYLHAYRLIFPKDNPLGLPDQLTAEIPSDFKKFLNDSLINWNGELIMNCY